jgi:hypothetical protein
MQHHISESLTMRFHITIKSANAKTGPIPVTTSPRATCPSTCPFRKNGCYADSGPLALHWDAVSTGARGDDWPTLCAEVSQLPDGQLWRHNQAGDLPHTDGDIDAAAVQELTEANIGRRGFTYTHHDATRAHNLDVLERANVDGLTVNLSANTLQHADRLADTGLPVVVVLPITQTTNTTTPAGRRVVVCPATVRDDVSCATCQLCARADRQVIVGFPAHGTSKARVDAVACAGGAA